MHGCWRECVTRHFLFWVNLLTFHLYKLKTVRCKLSNNMVRLHNVLLPFYSNFVLFYQHYKALLYVYFLFSWYFKKKIFVLVNCFVLWCELICPCVILFVYSRAVPIEVTERILICETHVFDSLYSQWIEICFLLTSSHHSYCPLFLSSDTVCCYPDLKNVSISIKIVGF